VNKAELTAALAMRTKMSKADATRTIEALFDDKGIIAVELKKARSSDHRVRQLRSRKRAAKWDATPRRVVSFRSRRRSRRRSALESSSSGGEQQEVRRHDDKTIRRTSRPVGRLV